MIRRLRPRRWAPLCLLFVLAVAPASADRLPLKHVPKKVIKAARKAVRGIRLVSAETAVINRERVYRLVGWEDDDKYRLTIKPSGHVIRIVEVDDDDDDEDDDDEEDDEDEDEDDDEEDEDEDDEDRD